MSSRKILVLAAALLAVTTSCREKAREKSTDPILARVGPEVIRQSEVDLLMSRSYDPLQAMRDPRRARRMILDQLIKQKLIYLAAKDEGLDQDPQVKTMLKLTEEQILQNEYYRRHLSRSKRRVSDKEIQDYYDQNRDRFTSEEQVHLLHIKVKSKKLAEKLITELENGADFATLAKRYSLDNFTKDKGGDLGYITRGRSITGVGGGGVIEDFVEVAFDTDVGEIAGPIKVRNYYHVIKVLEKGKLTPQPMNEVKGDIAQELRYTRMMESEKSLLEKLKKRYPVKEFPEATAVKPDKTARQLFQEAQDAGDPRQKILILSKIGEFYPDTKDAAKALFMVGIIYAQELQDPDKAEVAFRKVLEKYPNTDLAYQSREIIRRLHTPGSDLEEILLNSRRLVYPPASPR